MRAEEKAEVVPVIAEERAVTDSDPGHCCEQREIESS